VQYQNQDFWER